MENLGVSFSHGKSWNVCQNVLGTVRQNFFVLAFTVKVFYPTHVNSHPEPLRLWKAQVQNPWPQGLSVDLLHLRRYNELPFQRSCVLGDQFKKPTR
jgi:hypothetical protein